MLALGTTTTGDGATAPFSVKKDGTLYAEKGNVGGWILSQTALYKPHTATVDGVSKKVYSGFKIPSNTNHLEDKVLFMGATDFNGSNAPFYVRADGAIYSTSGQFGGWTLTPTGIKGGFNLTCPTSKWTKQGVVICNFSYILCRILHSAFAPVLVAI